MTVLTALLMALAALGWGALALRACGVAGELPWRERAAWSFGLGMGILGWLGFFLALAARVDAMAIAAVLVAGLPGLWLLRPIGRDHEPLTPWTWALLAAAAFIALGDLAEGLAPPTDADSLAYHFAIPREILRRGHLIFVPRAADGAIPLLQQMSHMLALGLGGEQAMTLWAGLSGWAAVFLTYAVGRRHLSRDWALAAAVAVASLPAVLYGGGSGQVETRMAAFTTMALVAVMESRRRPGLAWAALAGLAAGFCMASKYPGLLVTLLCGVAVLAQRGGLAKAAAFSAAALVAGLQWYGWNWANTGDPVFPMLFGLVPYHPATPWNAAQHALFKVWGAHMESPLPRGLADILSYPWRVTFAPPDSLDAGRTGLGPLAMLLAPFAVLGAWRHRTHPVVRSWLVAALIGLGFYALWSVFGASQRVRHYLPFMPMVVIGLLAASLRGTPRLPLAAGLAAVILIQVGGQAVFARNFVHRLTAHESRTAFVERNVGWAYGVTWANAHLGPSDKIITNQRQWLYLLDPPALFVTPNQQAEVEVREDNTEPAPFWRQLRRNGISHAMLPDSLAALATQAGGDGLPPMMGRLLALGCAGVVEELQGPAPPASRTLSTGTGRSSVVVLALKTRGCPLDEGK
ncbi:hypothetical protein CU669_00485 [Paramagnetospirillum kuznetsovii]|uniref:Glycosyltransferase RgtA/B/C/D-like domain-containing protein n=1 Tax=Paramagnetospirillum kuznetsovii TaxID=2053833 RepID=A0A364P2N9_9PROT|nr:glycosyltransferase family 39 protein [Paramagnetospirillum kuznetsovii]RAU23619.1 hypothetical protein CU669_00485 [Paramagnetospirillum kuznetsovii]